MSWARSRTPYACAYLPHLDNHLVGVATIALDPTDLFGDLVSLGLEVIRLLKRDPAALVQRQNLVDGIHETPGLSPRDGGLYDVGLASEPPNVKHVTRNLLKELILGDEPAIVTQHTHIVLE